MNHEKKRRKKNPKPLRFESINYVRSTALQQSVLMLAVSLQGKNHLSLLRVPSCASGMQTTKFLIHGTGTWHIRRLLLFSMERQTCARISMFEINFLVFLIRFVSPPPRLSISFRLFVTEFKLIFNLCNFMGTNSTLRDTL